MAWGESAEFDILRGGFRSGRNRGLDEKGVDKVAYGYEAKGGRWEAGKRIVFNRNGIFPL